MGAAAAGQQAVAAGLSQGLGRLAELRPNVRSWQAARSRGLSGPGRLLEAAQAPQRVLRASGCLVSSLSPLCISRYSLPQPPQAPLTTRFALLSLPLAVALLGSKLMVSTSDRVCWGGLQAA